MPVIRLVGEELRMKQPAFGVIQESSNGLKCPSSRQQAAASMHPEFKQGHLYTGRYRFTSLFPHWNRLPEVGTCLY